MDRRSIVAVVLGVVSVACATGVFQGGPSHPPVVAETLGADQPSQIVGVVRDQSTGYGLRGALVIVQCTCLAGARETMSSEGGTFGFRDLPPGKYTVQVLFKDANVNRTVELAPATRVRTDFRVDPDVRFTVTITLHRAAEFGGWPDVAAHPERPSST